MKSANCVVSWFCLVWDARFLSVHYREVATWYDMSLQQALLGCRVVRAPEVKWEGQVGIWGPLIWAKLHSLPVQESGRLDQVGTVVAFGHPECPAGLCKVTIVAAIEWDLPPKPGNLGRQKWRVPCPGEKLPLWTSRQIWADHTWLGPHWHFSFRN